MPRIDELFTMHTARSTSLEEHEAGAVSYVTNGLRDNGIVGYVTPLPKDKVFKTIGITVSAFCEATIQVPPFIARGNGGSGLIVLEPKEPMTLDNLGFVAAYINAFIRWRFSWDRQASVQRIRRLTIPDPKTSNARFPLKELLPAAHTIQP